MRKFILTVLCLFITTLGANASTTVVRYNNAGAPVSVSNGWHAPVSVQRARTMYGYNDRNMYRRNRYARPSMPYSYRRTPCGAYNNQPQIANYNIPTQNVTGTVNSISRFDKNYTIRPRRSYVSNGVTYYN